MDRLRGGTLRARAPPGPHVRVEGTRVPGHARRMESPRAAHRLSNRGSPGGKAAARLPALPRATRSERGSAAGRRERCGNPGPRAQAGAAGMDRHAARSKPSASQFPPPRRPSTRTGTRRGAGGARRRTGRERARHGRRVSGGDDASGGGAGAGHSPGPSVPGAGRRPRHVARIRGATPSRDEAGRGGAAKPGIANPTDVSYNPGGRGRAGCSTWNRGGRWGGCSR